MQYGTFDKPPTASHQPQHRPGASLAEMYSGASSRNLNHPPAASMSGGHAQPPPSYDDAVTRSTHTDTTHDRKVYYRNFVFTYVNCLVGG